MTQYQCPPPLSRYMPIYTHSRSRTWSPDVPLLFLSGLMLNVPVKSYGHVGTVNSPNHTLGLTVVSSWVFLTRVFHQPLYDKWFSTCPYQRILLSSPRLTPVLKTIFHQRVILYTCSQSYSDGSVKSHQSKTGYKYMI